jgi:hypothetical protein
MFNVQKMYSNRFKIGDAEEDEVQGDVFESDSDTVFDPDM